MRLRSVQGCYEKELKLNPALKGKVVVRFVIRTTGRVGDVSIDQNTMGSAGVGSCIVNLVRTWVFPMKLEEDTPVSFPFVFSSGG
jgi:TonB family protein